MWIQTLENGEYIFIYESVDVEGNRQLEMMSTDMVQDNRLVFGTFVYFGFVLSGIICLLILLVKGVDFLIKKIRKKEKEITKADKQIVVQQLIQGVSGVILFCLIMLVGAKGYRFAVFSCIMVVLLGIASMVNGIILFKNIGKDNEIGRRRKIKQYIWVFFGFGYVAIIVWFRLYDFVHI